MVYAFMTDDEGESGKNNMRLVLLESVEAHDDAVTFKFDYWSPYLTSESNHGAIKG